MRTPTRSFEVIELLTRHGVDFMVVGMTAGALQGASAVTFDLDILYSRAPDKIAGRPKDLAVLPLLEATLARRRGSEGTRIECRFEDETIWLSQRLIAELFQKDVRTINEHIGHIIEEGELAEDSVIRRFRITAADGKNYETQHYNLEMIIAVGYRVRSHRGTQFRRWATARLNEYLVKGFTMDDERLKNPSGKGHTDYFDELLERIRDIRASERRMYLRVRDILALAADYSPTEPQTQAMFQAVQNKLHFA